MVIIRITEIKLSYTNHHISHVIFAILFDSLLGSMSFEILKPMSIFHTVLIGSSLACINGALLTAYILKINNKQDKESEEEKNTKKLEKKSKKEKKQKILLCKEIVLNNNLPSTKRTKNIKLLKCYQILAILAPAILGLYVILKFISIYYYLTFLIIFPTTYLYSKTNKTLQKELSEVKDIYIQTAFISIAFIILMLVARILTYNFPAF